jgi:hypothetical protein
MLVALIMIGTISVLGGALVAALSDYWPQRQAIVQECGGGLFLFGVTLIACCFPQI